MIVGARQPSASHSVHIPELLRRYPSEDHKDFPLPPDVVFFCQPEGCVSIGQRRMSLRETNSFVFSLCDKDTSRVRYGICVNFYRPVEKRSPSVGSFGGKKAAGDLSTDDKVPPSSSNARADQSGRSDEEKEPRCSSEAGADGTSTTPSPAAADPKGSKRRLKRQQSSCTNSLTSLCLISHHPFMSSFREILFILKKFIETCSDRNTSRKSPTSRHWRK